jgi:hypothetical protein
VCSLTRPGAASCSRGQHACAWLLMVRLASMMGAMHALCVMSWLGESGSGGDCGAMLRRCAAAVLVEYVASSRASMQMPRAGTGARYSGARYSWATGGSDRRLARHTPQAGPRAGSARRLQRRDCSTCLPRLPWLGPRAAALASARGVTLSPRWRARLQTLRRLAAVHGAGAVVYTASRGFVRGPAGHASI